MNSCYTLIQSHPGWGWAPTEEVSTTKTQIISLARRATRAWPLGLGETLRFEATLGSFWVTRSGRPEDWVLQAGETQEFMGPSLVVMEALTASAEARLTWQKGQEAA